MSSSTLRLALESRHRCRNRPSLRKSISTPDAFHGDCEAQAEEGSWGGGGGGGAGKALQVKQRE